MPQEYVDTTLLDGYAGGPHITVEQVGLANQGLYGADDYVLGTGKKAAAQILTNNSIRIFDAVYVIQGRRDVINANGYKDVSIANGSQGMNRNDIIVRRYEKDESSEIEKTSYAVIKGVPVSGVATDPEVTVGDIKNGATLHEMALYRVRLNGLNIIGIDPLFKTLVNMSEIQEMLTELNSKIDPYRVIDFNTTGRTTYVKYANGVMIQFGIASVSYTDGCGTATFAHPFIDTSYAFFTTGAYVNSTYPCEIITCQKISNNKTYIYSRNPQGNKVETHAVDWLAIGKWK